MSETLYNGREGDRQVTIEVVDIDGHCWIEVLNRTDGGDIVLSQSDAARLGWALVDRYA